MEPDPIDAPELALALDARGRLVASDASGRRSLVEPIRAFPLSDPRRWIALVDDHGRELACLADPDRLDPESRAALDRALADREFVPEVRRILHVSSDSAPAEWTVETDRGVTSFTVESDDDVRRLAPGRLLIADSRGLRYSVSDLRALDASSRRILDRYL